MIGEREKGERKEASDRVRKKESDVFIVDDLLKISGLIDEWNYGTFSLF